jgi:hypothetical protein
VHDLVACYTKCVHGLLVFHILKHIGDDHGDPAHRSTLPVPTRSGTGSADQMFFEEIKASIKGEFFIAAERG